MMQPDTPRFFEGRRSASEGTAEVIIHRADGLRVPLPMRLDLRSHSPTGLEWGYLGSGPAQLALALACAVVDDSTAERVYQDLKDEVVAGLVSNEWRLSADFVLGVVMRLARDPAAQPSGWLRCGGQQAR